MGQFYNYVGVGGINYGTQFPSAGNGTLSTSEAVLAQTPLPDVREGIQGGVLITAEVDWGICTCSVASIYCRQSTLGTTATTGAMLGTYITTVGTVAATLPPNVYQWVDNTGTYPIPSYQLTGLFAAGSGTILKAIISATPIAE